VQGGRPQPLCADRLHTRCAAGSGEEFVVVDTNSFPYWEGISADADQSAQVVP
jgi:hypothetical protein